MYINIFPGSAHFKYWILVLNHIIWEKFISNTLIYMCFNQEEKVFMKLFMAIDLFKML